LDEADEKYNNDKKTEDSKVLKNALSDELMLAKALKSGVKALKQQRVSELKYTNVDN
jgi:hypothetical protein